MLFSPTLERLLYENIIDYGRDGDYDFYHHIYKLLNQVSDYNRGREMEDPQSEVLAIAKKEAISDLREATEQDVLILRSYLAERDPDIRPSKCHKV